MRLRMNYSKRCSRRRFPQRVSIDPNLGRSVTISLSECKDIFVGVTRRVSGIPSVYVGMQFSSADLRCGNGVASSHLRILPRSDSSSLALAGRAQSTYSYCTETSVWSLSGYQKKFTTAKRYWKRYWSLWPWHVPKNSFCRRWQRRQSYENSQVICTWKLDQLPFEILQHLVNFECAIQRQFIPKRGKSNLTKFMLESLRKFARTRV